MFGSRHRCLSVAGAVGGRASVAIAVALAAACVGAPAAQADDRVAFQADTGHLWEWNSTTGAGHDRHLGMMKGTSPSIIDSGFYIPNVHIAFQADTGHLWEYTSSAGAGHDRHLGMMAGTSPSVLAAGQLTTEIAFQADTGHLWTWTLTSGGRDLHLGMMKGT